MQSYIEALQAALFAANVMCGGVDDTPAIQQAVNASADVTLAGNCKVNGWQGIQVPTGRRISGGGTATVTLIPGCTSQGWPCRIFETRPNTGDIVFRDMTLIGELNATPKYQTLIRVDASVPQSGARWSVHLKGITCKNAKSDCVYVGGNTPSRGVRMVDLAVDGFGRNGVSITHADDVLVDGLECKNAKTGADPGACVDVESNAGESTANITILNVKATNVKNGVYMHKYTTAKNGRNLKVLDSTFDVWTSCVISNSGDHVAILDTVCKAADRGISVGAHAEEGRSTGVIVWGNEVQAPIDVMLAGVRDVSVEENQLLGSGGVSTAALGAVGKVEMDNEAATQAAKTTKEK